MTEVAVVKQAHGRTVTDTDPCGGVFVAAQGAARPIDWQIGHPSSSRRDAMFTCPVSAIPEAVWDLLSMWWQCRTLNALPVAGGFLDQPVIVRRAFPVFEQEMRKAERLNQETAQANATTALMAAVAGRGLR